MPRPPKKFHPHPFEYHQEIELTIDSLSNLGAGIGRVDGWVVFVPYTLPGERVIARIYRNDKSFSQGDLIDVIDASPDRVAPSCPLFGDCGGCQYQHLAYHRQLEWKSRQVAELLHHMAGIDHPVETCRPSPRQWAYRSKITPHFDRPRNGEIGPIGFRGISKKIVDVPQCPIAMEEINAAMPAIRADIHARAGTFKRGGTLLLRATQGHVESDHRQIAVEHVNGMTFHFLAGDFFQNNPFILPDFTRYVASQAKADGIRFLVDAYCGSGLFALTLSSHFEQVCGVEVSESSCQFARENAKRNGIAHASFLTASAEEIFAGIEFPGADSTVIIDPPRRGATAEFLDQLIDFCPARVVYVSCDPATQVRDIRQLTAAGYSLETVQPFDLFPNTRHLECVMTLVKRSSVCQNV